MGRTAAWFVVATVVLVGALAVSLSLGALTIALSDVLSWMTGSLADGGVAERVLSGVRFPRSFAAIVVGACLGLAGAALQGIHRTPVIDGHLIGMSAASGLGVAVGYAIAPAGNNALAAVALGAAVGGLYGLMSNKLVRPGAGVTALVLVGLALGLALTAWTGLFVLAVDSAAVPTLSFFIFGSLSTATWTNIALALPLAVASIATLWWLAPGIDLLSLGPEVSTHLGFDARRRVPIALAAIGVAIGASVALGGVIGFVGLIVPMVVRPMIGPAHRLMIPASAIVGATAVLLFDTAARTLVSPVEVPIGLLTAAIGGPALVWLIRKESNA